MSEGPAANPNEAGGGSALIADLLAHGQRVRFPARGDSMHPLIREGDTLHVDPVGGTAVRPGEVVLARAARGLTAHRVVACDAASVVTRGDNAPGDDEPLAPHLVIGRVVLVERAGRAWPVRRLSGAMLQFARFVARVAMRLG